MIVLILIAIALLSVAAYFAGIIRSLILIAITAGIVLLSIKLNKKGKDVDGLMKFFIGVSVLAFGIGLILFLVGLMNGETSTSFTGNGCSVCGGDGSFMGKECTACFGGWELANSFAVANTTWFGLLMAISAAVVFFTSLVIKDT